MRIQYDPETDIVTCEIASGKIDHAAEKGPFIIHFDPRQRPVLIEIQDGSRFIGDLTRIALRSRKKQFIPHPVKTRRPIRYRHLLRDSLCG